MKTYKLHGKPDPTPGERLARSRRALARRKPLTRRQLAALCIAANEAAESHGVTGTKAMIAWRRSQQYGRFGLRSLTAATQAQYLPLLEFFQSLQK